jgi:hypothetical protein
MILLLALLFECHFKLIADQFEVVALVLLVPHALVRFVLMGLLAMELLALGECFLLCFVVLVLLLCSAATSATWNVRISCLACTWYAFFFG